MQESEEYPEVMQAQIDKNMEPPAKKYKPQGHDIKGKGNKDQFDFNTEISFAIQECQQQISRGNIEDLSANLTSIATKLKKRNKLIKLADRSPAGWSIVQEYEQDHMASDSDDAQKIRQAEQKAIRKKKVKTLFTRTPKVQTPAWVAENKATGEKTV